MSHKQTQDFGDFVEEAYQDIARMLWEQETQELNELIEEYFHMDLEWWLENKLTQDTDFFDGVINRIWTHEVLGPKLYEIIAQDAEGRYGYDERMEPEYSQER